MLTNPNYFKTGAHYPPLADASRIHVATDYISLYKADIASYRILYPKEISLIEKERQFTELAQLDGVIPRIQINLFKKLSRYWSQMLYSAPPVIDLVSPANNIALQPFINQIYDKGMQVALDASRVGTGVMAISNDNMGRPVIRRIDARHWYPVVEASDPCIIIGDVLAIPYIADPGAPGQTTAFPDRLKVTKLVVGEPIVVQTFKLEGTSVGTIIDTSEGDVLRQRAVIQLANGDECGHYGESDYVDIIPMVAELNRRHSGISSVLDRHTNPHLTGPRGAITRDAAGVGQISTDGQYFPIDENELPPNYITWDANLTANFSQIESMLYQFYVMSDTSSAAFGIQGDGNAVESGAALRKLLFSSFLRLNALRRSHTQAITNIVETLIPGAIATITWPESSTDGMSENATTESIRIASGTTTRADAIARLDNVGKAEAVRIAGEATTTEPAPSTPPVGAT